MVCFSVSIQGHSLTPPSRRSTVGRFLHASYWPSILRTDSAAGRGVRWSVALLTYSKLLTAILIGIAAVVTPLGLYEDITENRGVVLPAFHYVKDNSDFGYATPPRATTDWSRICGAFGPVACPGTLSNITSFTNRTGSYWSLDWYDVMVPQARVEMFQSGLSKFSKSVSSFFDIQWRTYTWSLQRDKTNSVQYNNGTPYPVGARRMVQSVMMSDRVLIVEGLVVDMKNGGVGFRNHTAPPWQQYGSTWTEDLLFIEPVSQCINTNLTIDYSMAKAESETDGNFGSRVVRLDLVDRGGFVNLNTTYPYWDRSDTQANPELWGRAYKAAWLNNAYTMMFMNVTNSRNQSDNSSRAFSYLKSEMGKTFPLQRPDGSGRPYTTFDPNAIDLSSSFGYYTNGLDERAPGSNESSFGRNSSITYPAKPAVYPNPFKVTSSMFNDACELDFSMSGWY